MPNLGEEICGEYLNHIKKCEFISYNITNPDTHGEIDVIGINLEPKLIYVCEVAVHTQGLLYPNSQTKRPDDFNRLASKIDRDIIYAKKYFSKYEILPMIWSPVVKSSKSASAYNTLNELKKVQEHIVEKHALNVELVINEKFANCIEELKKFTDTETSEFKSNVMRMFQIERTLENHLKKMHNNKKK